MMVFMSFLLMGKKSVAEKVLVSVGRSFNSDGIGLEDNRYKERHLAVRLL